MKKLILITGTSARLHEDDINKIIGNTILTNDGDSYDMDFDRYIDITDIKVICKFLADNGIVTMSKEMYNLFK